MSLKPLVLFSRFRIEKISSVVAANPLEIPFNPSIKFQALQVAIIPNVVKYCYKVI